MAQAWQLLVSELTRIENEIIRLDNIIIKMLDTTKEKLIVKLVSKQKKITISKE